MRDLSLVSVSHFGRKWHCLMPRGVPRKKGEQKAAPGTWQGLGCKFQLHPRNREDSAALDTNPEQEEFTHYTFLT